MNSTRLSQLAELCVAKGIRHAIVCPGSRSAPLTLAFVRNSNLTCWTFSDERSAAFIAMAMAQQTRQPVILVCTSGSAAYNFAPAVAESYFQQVPLIVFTADRPKEWIDQLDGQTMRQTELFGKHVKRYFELPQEYGDKDYAWHTNRIVNEAINLAQSGAQGPVHINAPFREPLYHSTTQKAAIPGTARNFEIVSKESTLSESQWAALIESISPYNRILIVPGQMRKEEGLCRTLSEFHDVHGWPFVGDILCNLHELPFFCRRADTFLGPMPDSQKESLQPDLLITFGRSLVAKNLKLFLRHFSPKQHWHLQTSGDAADTFQSLTKIIPVHPEYFFKELRHQINTSTLHRTTFGDRWLEQESKVQNEIKAFFESTDQGEFKFLQRVMNALPSPCNLHLANSMSVRYANHIGLDQKQNGITVFSNRGTSGIDGCTSTAVGHALTSMVPNILITGDQAFFYDRNAFWHNYWLPNLFVIVLNNHGGIIFNLIDGPAALPESEEFFVTRQNLRAKPLADEFGFSYSDSSTTNLEKFFQSDGNAKILEMESTQSQNKSLFEAFRKHIKKSYEA